MHYMEILLLTLITAGYGQKDRELTEKRPVMFGEAIHSRHHRYKRTSCPITLLSQCMCGDYCSLVSSRDTFSTYCGNSVTQNCCVVKSGNSYQLSTNCPEYGTYLDVACTWTGASCSDGLTPYTCTCSAGYLPTTTTSTTTTSITTVSTSTTPPSDPPTTIIVAVIVSILFVGGIAIAATLLYRRLHKRRKSAMLEKNILAGFIPIKCNVMAVVDDVDEFKDYTKRLMVALQDRLPKLVFERVSTFDVLKDNYKIKCDKLLVFRRTQNVILKGHTLSAITEKVQFRNDKERSVVVLCVGNDVMNKTEVREMVDELCLVPSLKNIEGWLPAIIKTLFDVKERCFSICNSTYFISSDEPTVSSEYCHQLRTTVESILTRFGATVAQSENAAMCKIVLLDSTDDRSLIGDEAANKNRFIFVSFGTSLCSFKQKSDMNLFGRKDVILGIIRLLYKLNLISRKRLPNIEAIRYNQRTQEFVKYDNNSKWCV